MPDPLEQKIKQTQSAFPAQPTGAVARCPLKKADAKTAAAPVEVKTDFALTQQIMQTLGAGAAAPARTEEKAKEKKAWIEIILVDAEGKPMPGVRYRITTPDGQKKEGRLDQHGQAGLYAIDPGNCKITFPDLDKDAWE